MRVTVLGINYAPEPTGIAPYTAGLATGLAERGHEVSVVTTYPHYPQWRVPAGWTGMSKRERVGDINVVRVRHYVPSRPTGLRRAVSEATFGARLALRTWAAPDVVICVSPALLSTVLAQSVRRWHGSPALGVIVQDLYSVGITETAGAGSAVARSLSAVERRTLRRADGVVAIHDRFKARMVDHLEVDAERVSVIRNWTHVSAPPHVDRQARRAALGWRPDELVVLHTGAMGEKQGLSNVVQAARAGDRRGSPVRFVLMGDGGQRGRLEAEASGVERLDLLAPVASDDYAATLAAADLLLVNERPGLVEMAVPSKLTSYFRSGVAVLAATDARSTTASEVAAAGAGQRVDPGEPEALLDAALKLGAEPETLLRLGAAGPNYCDRVLSQQVALDSYDHWVRLLGNRRAV